MARAFFLAPIYGPRKPMESAERFSQISLHRRQFMESAECFLHMSYMGDSSWNQQIAYETR